MGKIATCCSFKSGIRSYLVANYMHMHVSKGVLKLLLEVPSRKYCVQENRINYRIAEC